MGAIRDFIKNRQSMKSEYLLFNKVPIFILDQIQSKNSFSILNLIKRLEAFLPSYFKFFINSIVILDDPIFNEKKVNAFYHDNNLYVSNTQDDLNDILDDIVHEFAHAMEDKYHDRIYADNEIKTEFLKKRNLLKLILSSEGYNLENYDFNTTEYNKELDKLFYETISYEKINNLTNYGLFVSPYAVTSLREYFATGFEEYILGDHSELENISPKIYKKLDNMFVEGE